MKIMKFFRVVTLLSNAEVIRYAVQNKRSVYCVQYGYTCQMQKALYILGQRVYMEQLPLIFFWSPKSCYIPQEKVVCARS